MAGPVECVLNSRASASVDPRVSVASVDRVGGGRAGLGMPFDPMVVESVMGRLGIRCLRGHPRPGGSWYLIRRPRSARFPVRSIRSR